MKTMQQYFQHYLLNGTVGINKVSQSDMSDIFGFFNNNANSVYIYEMFYVN